MLLTFDNNEIIFLNLALYVFICRLGALWHTTSQIYTSVTVEVSSRVSFD